VGVGVEADGVIAGRAEGKGAKAEISTSIMVPMLRLKRGWLTLVSLKTM